MRVELSLHTHYRFLNDQYALARFMQSVRKPDDQFDEDLYEEYATDLWLEMVEVWDRMSFRQKCWALNGLGYP